METDRHREIASVVVLSEESGFSVGSEVIDFLLVSPENSSDRFLGEGLCLFGGER